MSGLRAGTLPGVSQQNGFLGLPMTLMQEETAYLVQQGQSHVIVLILIKIKIKIKILVSVAVLASPS